ncbi:MAG: DUF5916 domain-containing protein [Bacteroidota bacterium]
MKNALIFLIILCVSVSYLSAQNTVNAKKQLEAKRVEAPPKIDGLLDDVEWQTAQLATDFVQQSPTPGAASFQNTEVRFLYDNTALYIGVMLYEPSLDSVSKTLTQRDGLGNVDFFGVFIDAYQDGINALEFLVTAAGVQWDAKMSTNGEDSNWDAVWHSAVHHHDNGWSIEYKIPYSALRFPDTEVQKWGVNLLRSTYRNGERVWWSELKPEVNGFMNQAGELNGIRDVKPPVRLSFSPFVSYNVNHYPHNTEGVRNTTTAFNAGMDIKYGINEAFTLDMTLVPDFGQVASDNQILNLSPFETFFSENRQFFTEGTELFSKAGIFYSRRIGGTPGGFWDAGDFAEEGETLIDNPSEIQLINSTKISGRNKGGLGIGVLNSVTARMNAKIENDESGEVRKVQTEPFTNYNVLVFDQNLKNNSYISLINTNVFREGDAYEANVTATEFQIRNKKNTYSWEGESALSQKYYDGFSDVDLGFRGEIEFSKTSGNFNFDIEYEFVDENYDHNDLGFLRFNNYHSTEIELNYNRYKPFGKVFRAQYNGIRMEYNRLHSPGKFADFGIVMYSSNNFKNFWYAELWTYMEPFKTYDHYEPRVEGRFYENPRNYNVGMSIGTDSRKKIGTWINWNTRFWEAGNRMRINFDLNPRIQISEKMNLRMHVGSYNFFNDVGYATILDNDDIIFGQRDQITVSNSLSASYTFNDKMWITMRVRHYWSKATYEKFFLLTENGKTTHTEYNGLDEDGQPAHNINFNSFNVDFAYRWRFAPGSEMSFVWKNSILASNEDISGNYFNNLGNTFKENQNNLLSVKILYYLDYLYFKKKK